MTSLPSVYSGLIWDGVTEYADERIAEDSSAIILHLDDAGARQILEYRAAGNQPFGTMLYSRDILGWTTIGVSTDETTTIIGRYFGYDGFASVSPVNQIGYLIPFTIHAARFTHQLDAGLGLDSSLSLEEDSRIAVKRLVRDMISSAVVQYDKWGEVDPEELIVGGNYDGTLLWKRTLANMIDLDDRLCGQCDLANLARQIFIHADIAAIKQLRRDGIIYGIDYSTDPWSPTVFDFATLPHNDYYDLLDDVYERMIIHYDTVVAPADVIALNS